MENLFLNFKHNSRIRLVFKKVLLLGLGFFLFFIFFFVFKNKAYAGECDETACSGASTCSTRSASCGHAYDICPQCMCIISSGCEVVGGVCINGTSSVQCKPEVCCEGNGEICEGCGHKCKEYSNDNCSGDPYQTDFCAPGLSCAGECHGTGDGDNYSYKACYAPCCRGSSTKYSFNGTIRADDTGGHWWVPQNKSCTPPRGISISGNMSNLRWPCDGARGGHFDAEQAAGAVAVTLTPAAGYDTCSWYILNYSTGAPTGESGDTCVAVFSLPTSNWKRGVSFTMHRSAYIQGRVSMDADRNHYFSPNCSGCTGTCDDVPGLNITCTRDSDTFNTSWSCNPRAYYGTGRVFRQGNTVSCDITFPSTDYELVGWYLDNLANGVPWEDCPNPGFCTASGLVLDQGDGGTGDNNLWFLVDPTLRDPWWQVINGDVAANGGLASLIPLLTCESPDCEPFFDLEGPGGYPGVPSYMGTADFAEGADDGTVSSPIPPFGWLAESETVLSKVYDYQYFESMIPSDVIVNTIDSDTIVGGELRSGISTGGYLWHKREGNLTITGTPNLQSDKVILLVTGNLYIGDPTGEAGAKIWLRDGVGFFAAIVGGNIEVSPKSKVDQSDPKPVLEGIFLAGGQFKTGTTGAKDDGQFWLRGSVAAYDGELTGSGISLERDMTNAVAPEPNNNEMPAELFEYAPDLILTFPREFASRRLRWKEVAP